MAIRPTRAELALRWSFVMVLLAVAIWAIVSFTTSSTPVATGTPTSTAPRTVATPSPVPGVSSADPPVNVYAGTANLQPLIANDPARVYVPSGLGDVVTVIDERTKKVISVFKSSTNPQHVVPSYDLRTLWVLNNKNDNVVPITASTGSVGSPIAVTDPYNLYFTLDGKSAIVVAERFARLDFRDPQTMKLQSSLQVTGCDGINHADFSADGSYVIVTCEFAAKLAKIDMVQRKVVGLLELSPPPGADSHGTGTTNAAMAAMPQDIRLAPDGKRFYVADMVLGGLHVIDGASFTETGFIPTGVGAHGITPSHDGTKLYVANRGSPQIKAGPKGPGSVSVVDVATGSVIETWKVPGGGSPDMGNLNADGSALWLSGRFDKEVYAFDTTTGALLARIPVAIGPHGLTVWPQPGRFSLGHTGNMR